MQQQERYDELKEEEDIQLFRAPDIGINETIESFLITLIDGTGSMAEEYESIVKAHSKVFSYLGNNQLRYQWDEQIQGQEKLHNFLPFRDARGGNISLTFKCLFDILLSGDYPKNITIAFISDGVEPYDYNVISEQVQKMKEKHLIQFISIAVGEQFPNDISNDLRDHIHNQNKTCPPILYAKRVFVWTEDGMGRPKHEIESEFISIFDKIKELLKVSQKLLVVSKPAYQILTQEEPSQLIPPGAPFFTKNQEVIKIMNNVVVPENNPSLLTAIVKNTVQEVLIECSTLGKQNDSREKFSQIQNKVGKLLCQTEGIFTEANKKEKQQLRALLEVVDEIAIGNIELKNLNQLTRTELQANLDKPDAISDFIDQKAIQPEVIKMNPKQQLKQVETKFNKLKIGCFVRCKATKKELDLVESIEFTVFESLAEMRQLLKTGTHDNFSSWVQELKSVIHNSLQKIYQQFNSFTLTEKQLRTFYKVNEVLKLVDQFMKEEQNSTEKALAFLDTCIQLKTSFLNLPTSINECKHLPPILKTILSLDQQKGNLLQHRMTFLIDKEEVKPHSYLKQDQAKHKFSIRNFFVTDSNSRSCRKFECSTFRQAFNKMTNMWRSFTFLQIL